LLLNGEKQRTIRFLEDKGIETRPLLSFIPEQPPYKHEYNCKCPVAKDAYQRGFYVSNSPLLTKKELGFLASTLREALASVRK
ncbi:MAG: hypothetical protein JSV57_02220, partial [Candidatus Bathyarchaeota archaeon]